MGKILFFAFLFCCSCSVNRLDRQGIEGRVIWYEGDWMPGIDKPSGTQQPVTRTIYIYELTNKKDAETDDGIFYRNIRSRLIKKTTTNSAGRFKVSLPAGNYSIFVKEEPGFFANRLDGKGNIYPVSVMKGEVTEINLKVNYKAAY